MAETAKTAKSDKNTARKPKLSPELAELLHMLGSLEQHYAAETQATQA